jgi:hypothetical protein
MKGLKRNLLGVTVIFLCSILSSTSSIGAEKKNPFVGTWKLISFETRRSDGAVMYPFGKDLQGLIMYDAKGYWSCHIMGKNRPAFASGQMAKGSPEEIKAAFESSLCYWGTYDLDEKEKILKLHIIDSLYPNWRGADQKRFYEFSGNRYSIKTPPMRTGEVEIVSVLVWERVD